MFYIIESIGGRHGWIAEVSLKRGDKIARHFVGTRDYTRSGRFRRRGVMLVATLRERVAYEINIPRVLGFSERFFAVVEGTALVRVPLKELMENHRVLLAQRNPTRQYRS